MIQNTDYIDGKRVDEILKLRLRRVKSPGQTRFGRFDPETGRVYLTDDMGNLTGQIADIPGYKSPEKPAPVPVPDPVSSASPYNEPQGDAKIEAVASGLAYSDEVPDAQVDTVPAEQPEPDHADAAEADTQPGNSGKRKVGFFAIGAAFAAVLIYCVAMFVPGMQPIPW